MYNHTNMREVMEQWLSKGGYKTQAIDGSGITVEFVSAGTKAMPNDNKTYIDDDGSITYFTGNGYTCTHTTIVEVDPIYRRLRTEDGIIRFKDLWDVVCE